MDRFACETMVVSGAEAISILAEQACRRMMVVTEPGGRTTAMVRQVIRAAGNPETDYVDEVSPELSMKQAVEGSRQLKAFGPDLVVALGKENVMDCGKAMVCFSRQPCKLAVIPTVSGGGAEVTDRVTLCHNGRRHLLQDRAMRPALAILDSGMMELAGRHDIAACGFELLAAALEAYTLSNGAMLTDLHAREAFAVGWAVLPAAFAGNENARRRLQMASVMAGLAVNQTGLGLCRAMENSLGTVFGLSRGKLAGILLPAVIGCNAHAAGRRYAELSRAAGMGGSREEIGLRNLKTGLTRLRRELGLPQTLVQAGVDLRSVWSSGRRIVELTLEDPECRNNPVAVDDFMVRRILEEITGR